MSLRCSDSPALTIDGDTVTHGQVERETVRVAAALRRMKVGRGTRVAIVADPDLSVVVGYLAALRVGAIVTLPHPSYTVSELADLLTASSAELALATGDSLGKVVELSTDISTVGLKGLDRAIAGRVLDDGHASDGAAVEPALGPDSPAIQAFTSGSTGEPKPVRLSHRNLLTSIRGAMGAWRWSAADRLVHCLPIAHQHGLGAIHAALLSGSHAVILPRFDPERLISVADREQASVLFSVPAIYDRLLMEVPDLLDRLRGLRLMTSGSAPLAPETASRIQEATGQIPLERYGSTEAGLDVSNPYEGPRIPGTVGIALPGVEVAIFDPEGETIADGGTGEVVLRGPQVFRGYGTDEDRDAFVRGWFRTRDFGTIDQETGHLRLVGRTKDVIISGGLNVYPLEIEKVLREIPGVVDAAVIGVQSKRWGEAVTAFVVRAQGATQDLDETLQSRLAPHKRPKQIIEVDEIPRTEVGKLRRDELEKSIALRPS
jgi:malonyl-CoA/methylmalonyl-CoA synthetase